MDEQDIQRLLRLKRYEQPPPGYFEDFLHEFHRRQRAELLRRPLRQILFDRIQTVFEQYAPARVSYAAGAAVFILFVSIAVLQWGTPAEIQRTTAQAEAPSRFFNESPILALDQLVPNPQLNLPVQRRSNPVSRAGTTHTRYVIDARPVSYEPPFNF